MGFRGLYAKIFLGCILACASGNQDAGQQPILGVKDFPKNVVIILASGMSFEAVTTARVELAKIMWNGSSSNPFHLLPFEMLPHHGILMTYSSDFIPRNMESGIRTIFNGPTKRNNVSCKNINSSNIFFMAHNAGKSTGLVTTLSLTSEIPVAIFDFEEKYKSTECLTNSSSYDVIHQIFHGEIESKMKVIFGKSHSLHDKDKNSGEAKEGWEKLNQEYERKRSNIVPISSISSLKNVKMKKGEQAIGLFSEVSIDDLKIMTSKAIDFLKGNSEGYFLAVIIKNKNVVETVKMVSELIPLLQNSISPETLLIVSSDHAELVSNCDMGCLSNKTTVNNRRKLTLKQKIAENKTNISPPTVDEETKAGQTFKTTDDNLKPKKYSNETQNVLTNINKSSSAFITKPPTTSTEKYHHEKGQTSEIPVTISEEQSKNSEIPVTISEEQSKNSEISVTISEEQSKNTNYQVTSTMNTPDVEMSVKFSTIKSTVDEEENAILQLQISSTDKPTGGIKKSIAAHMENASSREEVSQTESIRRESNLTTGQPTKDREYSVSTKELNTTEVNLITSEKTAGFSVNDLTDVSEESSTTSMSNLDSSRDLDSSTNIKVDDSGDSGANASHMRKKREAALGMVLSDIPIYASGPMASLFRGIHKQDFLWKVMKKAICSSNESHNVTKCEREGIDHSELGDILEIKKSQSNEDISSGIECSRKYAGSSILIMLFSLVFN